MLTSSDISASYAQQCLSDLSLLGLAPESPLVKDKAGLPTASAWADSGLGGINAAPPLQVAALAGVADGVMAAFNSLMSAEQTVPWLGRRALGVRRLSHPLKRAGLESANGSCRFLRCRDGWLALNLARAEDSDLLPAWLEVEQALAGADLQGVVRDRAVAPLLARGRELGLPIALNAELKAREDGWFQVSDSLGVSPGERMLRQFSQQERPFRVLDLSSLWAGPLCTRLLGLAGAEVTKIEHPQRPDGARAGPANFYALMNQDKHSIALDLRSPNGREEFLALLDKADIVVDAFRPRVWAHLNLNPDELMGVRPGLSWLSITGHGHTEPQANWVAFGDDAAVAAGLSWSADSGQPPLFYGDAIADPLSGLHAALLAWCSYQCGGGHRLHISLSGVISHALAWLARTGLNAT